MLTLVLSLSVRMLGVLTFMLSLSVLVLGVLALLLTPALQLKLEPVTEYESEPEPEPEPEPELELFQGGGGLSLTGGPSRVRVSLCVIGQNRMRACQ